MSAVIYLGIIPMSTSYINALPFATYFGGLSEPAIRVGKMMIFMIAHRLLSGSYRIARITGSDAKLTDRGIMDRSAGVSTILITLFNFGIIITDHARNFAHFES